MALTHGQGDGADLEAQCRRHARGKKVTGYAASLARHWLALWITSTGWLSTECATFADVSRAFQQTRRLGATEAEWDSIATSKMKDGLQSAYEYLPTPNAELEWVGQPTSTRGVVCRLPCEMEGGNYTNTISAAIGAKLIDHANFSSPATTQGAMPPASAAASSMIKKELRCKRNLPANRLKVKKEGPTQGRLFYKCPAQVCNYFEWEPVELEKLQSTPKKEPEVSPELTKMMEEMDVAKKELQIREGSIKEREDSVLMMQQSLHEGVRNLAGTVVEQAEQRHQEVMESQHAQHVSQVEQLQNQLFWLTALAGKARVEEVIMNDLNKSQEVMQQAIQLRQRMMAAEP